MASFSQTNNRSLVAINDDDADERAYWDVGDDTSQQQRQQCGSAVSTSRRAKTGDDGFPFKLSAVEIGNVCGSVAKNVGNQAKQVGDQARRLSDQTKEYTMANTNAAAVALDRFKKQIVAAVDGVPLKPGEDSLRENLATTSVSLETTPEGLLLAEAMENEGGRCPKKHGGDAEDEAPQDMAEKQRRQQGDAPRQSCHKTSPVDPCTTKSRDQLNGGMVDESGPVLSLGALASAFKKNNAGGVPKAAGVDDPVDTASGAATPAGVSTTGVGRGGQPSEANVDPADLKLLPRTGSLVGGRQWAVVAAVYDTTASIVDEVVGDFFT